METIIYCCAVWSYRKWPLDHCPLFRHISLMEKAEVDFHVKYYHVNAVLVTYICKANMSYPSLCVCDVNIIFGPCMYVRNYSNNGHCKTVSKTGVIFAS